MGNALRSPAFGGTYAAVVDQQSYRPGESRPVEVAELLVQVEAHVQGGCVESAAGVAPEVHNKPDGVLEMLFASADFGGPEQESIPPLPRPCNLSGRMCTIILKDPCGACCGPGPANKAITGVPKKLDFL